MEPLINSTELLCRVHEAFGYMPHLHGAISDTTADDVRSEVNDALDYFWSDLCKAIGR